jgi:hypothetical protein
MYAADARPGKRYVWHSRSKFSMVMALSGEAPLIKALVELASRSMMMVQHHEPLRDIDGGFKRSMGDDLGFEDAGWMCIIAFDSIKNVILPMEARKNASRGERQPTRSGSVGRTEDYAHDSDWDEAPGLMDEK